MSAPYREPASTARKPEAGRYVPLTRRQDRLRRALRGLPVLLLALVGLAVGRPWLIVVGCMYGVVAIVIMRQSTRSLNARLKAIAGSIARDADPSVTLRSLEALVPDARAYPRFHSIGLLFMAVTRARSGDCDGALDLLYVIHDGGWLAHRDVWMAWLLPWLAQLHAARGDVERAQQWADAARARLPDRGTLLVGAEAILAIRAGRFDDAIARIDARLGDEVRAPGDPSRDHFALLRAFACDRAGNAVDSAAAVRELVANRQAKGELIYLPLERWWPDFADFLAKQQT